LLAGAITAQNDRLFALWALAPENADVVGYLWVVDVKDFSAVISHFVVCSQSSHIGGSAVVMQCPPVNQRLSFKENQKRQR
jgi:hypothetical protein